VESELKAGPIKLVKEIALDLPLIKLDFRTMKHVFINLFMYSIRAMSGGGTLRVCTYSRHINEDYKVQGRSSKYFKIGDTIVVAEIEDTASVSTDKPAPEPAKGKDASLGMAVLKKIVELYGGVVDVTSGPGGNKYALTFKIN